MCVYFVSRQIHFLLAVGRQGKVRVAKWYSSYTLKEKAKLTRDVTNVVFERPNKACNFVEYKGIKIIYRRYDYTVYSVHSPAAFSRIRVCVCA